MNRLVNRKQAHYHKSSTAIAVKPSTKVGLIISSQLLRELTTAHCLTFGSEVTTLDVE